MKLKDLTNELKRLNDSTQLSEEEYQILELAYLYEEVDFIDNKMLSEGKILDMVSGKLDGIAGKLKDLGFEFHNTKPGLIQVLAKGGKTLIKAFLLGLAATKAKAMNDPEKLKAVTVDAKAIAKEVQTAFTQENVVDVLMQLDQASAHLVTGPIHMFNSLTGIHIVLPWESKEHGGGHGENKDAPGITDIISSTIETLKDKITQALSPDKAAEAHAALDKVSAMANPIG